MFEKPLKFDFVKSRHVSYVLSAAISLLAIGMFFFKGLNYGIDFKGGVSIEIRAHEAVDLAAMRHKVAALGFGEAKLQHYGTPRDVLIVVEGVKGAKNPELEAVNRIKSAFGDKVEYRRIETVGPKVGEELASSGLQAIFWSLIAMLGYIWFRFEWQFGVCAIVALLHDAFVVFGIYSIFGVEFNITAIVAILITVGYSINDTVVIYDRIRENIKKFKTMAMPELINHSIYSTLSRTILTSTTTLTALLGLYFFGGEVIATYSFPIIIGVLIGTYSSIFMAAPLLVTIGLERRKLVKDEKEITPQI